MLWRRCKRGREWSNIAAIQLAVTIEVAGQGRVGGDLDDSGHRWNVVRHREDHVVAQREDIRIGRQSSDDRFAGLFDRQD